MSVLYNPQVRVHGIFKISLSYQIQCPSNILEQKILGVTAYCLLSGHVGYVRLLQRQTVTLMCRSMSIQLVIKRVDAKSSGHLALRSSQLLELLAYTMVFCRQCRGVLVANTSTCEAEGLASVGQKYPLCQRKQTVDKSGLMSVVQLPLGWTVAR